MPASDSPEGDGRGDQVLRRRHVPPPAPTRQRRRPHAFHMEGLRSACSVGERPPPPTASPRWPAGLGLHAPTG